MVDSRWAMTYRYYNMDAIVAGALALSRKLIGESAC